MNLSFCYKTALIWQIVGRLFFILKIIIPLLIIIIGIVDFSKASVSGEDKETHKAVNSLIRRIIIGIIIFFIPTLVKIVFDWVSSFNDTMKNDFKNCVTCVTSPDSCDTSYEGEFFK